MRIVIAAGEASGDQLGADLIRAARELNPEVRFAGIAGPAMREAGCEAWFDIDDLSVMGLAEVLRHLPRILRVRRGLLARTLADPPAAFVGVDAPDFNLRIANTLRAAGIPTVQYVCPSVWAWRQGRVHSIRRACDRVLCLLPFEVAFLERAGVSARFVGHPFADQLRNPPDKDLSRHSLGIDSSTVLTLLPGSRHKEIELLGPPFLLAAARVAAQIPGLACVAPMANAALRDHFAAQVATHAPGLALTLVDGRPREAIAAGDVVLAASGTVTLETMLIGRPMVAAYRFSPLTYWLAHTLKLVKVRYFSLPNLLADEALVPEFLQDAAQPEALAAALIQLLRDAPRRRALEQRFAALGAGLRRGAGEAAARAVLNLAEPG